MSSVVEKPVKAKEKKNKIEKASSLPRGETIKNRECISGTKRLECSKVTCSSFANGKIYEYSL
jgi:hypothetical protein